MIDVEALRPKMCGACDGGLFMECVCRDYRNDLDAALDEVERLRGESERAQGEIADQGAEIIQFRERHRKQVDGLVRELKRVQDLHARAFYENSALRAALVAPDG